MPINKLSYFFIVLFLLVLSSSLFLFTILLFSFLPLSLIRVRFSSLNSIIIMFQFFLPFLSFLLSSSFLSSSPCSYLTFLPPLCFPPSCLLPNCFPHLCLPPRCIPSPWIYTYQINLPCHSPLSLLPSPPCIPSYFPSPIRYLSFFSSSFLVFILL